MLSIKSGILLKLKHWKLRIKNSAISISNVEKYTV